MGIRNKGTTRYWTYERCKQEALKYNTKKELNDNFPSIRVIAKKRGWWSDISSHMKPIGHKYKRCIYSYEFSDNHVYIGLTSDLKRRHRERFVSKRDSVNLYKIKTGLIPKLQQLTEYLPVEEAKIKEGYFLNKYINDNWIALNVQKTGGLGSNELYWNKERCLEAIKSCETIFEFKSKFRGAYSASLKYGWWQEFKKLFKDLRKLPRDWDKESCRDLALKCRTRAEFKKLYLRAFTISYTYKWLDDICKHMINGHKRENWLNNLN